MFFFFFYLLFDEFCWIILWMWNLVDLYLLVLFHLLKVFLFPIWPSDPSRNFISAALKTIIKRLAFKSGSNWSVCTNAHICATTDSGCRCFLLTQRVMFVDRTCERCFSSSFPLTLNNNSRARRRSPQRRSDLSLHHVPVWVQTETETKRGLSSVPPGQNRWGFKAEMFARKGTKKHRLRVYNKKNLINNWETL